MILDRTPLVSLREQEDMVINMANDVEVEFLPYDDASI